MVNSLRELLDRKAVLAGLALVLGLGLGILYAWVVNPVQWVDATPGHLRPDMRRDYLAMAVESYSVNRNADLAIQRYRDLGPAAEETLAALGAAPGEISPTAIQNFRAVVEIYASGGPEEGSSGSGTSTAESPVRLILPFCAVTSLLGVLLAGALTVRGRRTRRGNTARTHPYGPELPAEPGPGMAHSGEREPVATFRTIYALGDDLYDDSFSIESAAGDFLGECGVGIGDLIGVGDPKKVSAFEVWLFDKNDIQTVTKVLMSRYAFNDSATRSRLAAKGDPMLAASGAVVNLETASLEVEARIVDLAYGEGALPAESYFERLTIELRAFQRGPARE
ncbi:MAG TPA: hypothetical protein VGA32_03390 [Anaerolineales bacterium]